MFYLAGNDFPRSARELASALRESLKTFLTLTPDEDRTVCIEGGNYPNVDSVRVDLSGANVHAGQIPPQPVGAGKSCSGLQAQKLGICAHPMRVQGMGIHFDLTAADVRFDYDRDKEGHPLLLLKEAREGDVEIKMSQRDLEALLLAHARTGAAAEGIVVETAALELAPMSRRSLAITVRLRVRKLFVRAAFEVRGQLEVDDGFNARLSHLSCEGSGPMGTLAGRLMEIYLARFNNLEVPLMAISLGNIPMQDLQIEVSDFLKVKAAFRCQGVSRRPLRD